MDDDHQRGAILGYASEQIDAAHSTAYPPWMVPQYLKAIKRFFEILPHTIGVPLGYQAILVIAFYKVMISTMVILPYYWVDQERLIYPLMITTSEK